MPPKLTSIHVAGLRSIRDATIRLGDRTVLIGSNGAGKSNLVSLFNLLSFASSGSLGYYVGKNGGASSLLHFGAKQTQQLELGFCLETTDATSEYRLRLAHAAEDTLIVVEEHLALATHGYQGTPRQIPLGAGHREIAIRDSDDPTARRVRHAMERWKVFHFHDTSDTSPMKGRADVGDNSYLRSDARNLAAFLLRLREDHASTYRRIQRTIREIAPFFDDFVLEPVDGTVLLRWREQGSPYDLGAHQLSDGTLRAICLVTLLRQPSDQLPQVVVIDEPELGLHPAAVGVIGELIRRMGDAAQVIVSTQSIDMLNQFEPDDVLVAEHNEGATSFTRLDEVELSGWLEEYSLGDLWQKNVLGARP